MQRAEKPTGVSGRPGRLPERGNIARKIHSPVNEAVPDMVNYHRSMYIECLRHNTTTNTTMATKEG